MAKMEAIYAYDLMESYIKAHYANSLVLVILPCDLSSKHKKLRAELLQELEDINLLPPIAFQDADFIIIGIEKEHEQDVLLLNRKYGMYPATNLFRNGILQG